MNTITVYPTLAFVKPDQDYSSTIGSIINWWCKSKYYHCELILGEHWLTVSPDYGVKFKPIRVLDKNRYDYVPLESKAINSTYYDAILEYINLQVSDKYDSLGIVYNQILGIDREVDNWFCSELVAEVLKRLGYTELDNHFSFEYSPQDLYDIFTGNKVEPRRYSIKSRVKTFLNKIGMFFIGFVKIF